MSSFYGDTTRLPLTPFQFDKIYTNKNEMNNVAQNDGVFLNRYVLLQKESDSGETYGEVYQKQFNEETKLYQYNLIASLTAPFTVGAVNTDFNLSYDYKETNLGISSEPNSANWTTNDSQNYILNLNIPAIGNALVDIYNVLAGLNTVPGDEREFNIIELDNGTPLDDTIALHNYPYHLAHENGVYYIIMPAYKEPPEVFADENTFNNYLESHIPIFICDISGYTDNLAFTYDSSLDYYIYEKDVSGCKLIPLSDFSNNIYGLIGYLNKLKDGEYPCDRTSLQGCIDYANQIIDEMQTLEEITLDSEVNQTEQIVDINLTLNYKTKNSNKITTLPFYFVSHDKISLYPVEKDDGTKGISITNNDKLRNFYNLDLADMIPQISIFSNGYALLQDIMGSIYKSNDKYIYDLTVELKDSFGTSTGTNYESFNIGVFLLSLINNLFETNYKNANIMPESSRIFSPLYSESNFACGVMETSFNEENFNYEIATLYLYYLNNNSGSPSEDGGEACFKCHLKGSVELS